MDPHPHWYSVGPPLGELDISIGGNGSCWLGVSVASVGSLGGAELTARIREPPIGKSGFTVKLKKNHEKGVKLVSP